MAKETPGAATPGRAAMVEALEEISDLLGEEWVTPSRNAGRR